uniref:Uncharacterized protein n=1 Tax=Arundo donax TaxID=35708 RepID=A0A0A9BQG4_ARUDO
MSFLTGGNLCPILMNVWSMNSGQTAMTNAALNATCK